ncbi:MAG: hypothetical protein KGQ37_12785 [Hyphomicrobiales bacterium]|nr:hypothetical protein [Hyphomicrobiales bacterium]
MTLRVDGQLRSAVVVEREPLKRQRRRVIIVLHGSHSSGARIRQRLALDRLIGYSGVVLVFPNAINGRWNVAGAALGKGTDLHFLLALRNSLVRRGIAQAHHIFLAGVSTGGSMALAVACRSPSMFVGYSAVLGNMPAALKGQCKLPRPTPLLLINATGDQMMPFDGGPTKKLDYPGPVLSAAATLQPFMLAAHCKEHAGKKLVVPLAPKSRLGVRIDRHIGCRVPVEDVTVVGGGHVIPGRHFSPNGRFSRHRLAGVDAARLIFGFSQQLR